MADDFSNDQTTTGFVPVNASVQSRIDTAGDHDWFAVNLQAGQNYEFDQRGSPSADGTLPNPQLTLRDSAGNPIASDDDSGLGFHSFSTGDNAQIYFHATTSGVYYLDAGASGDAYTGTYIVEAENVGTAPVFDRPEAGIPAFTASSGWTSQNQFPRDLGYFNYDDGADIFGFGQAGVWVSRASGDESFASPQFVLAQSGAQQGWTSDNLYHREVANVDGSYSRLDDIVGFGEAGVWVSLNNEDGTFSAPSLVLGQFGHGASAGNWTSQNEFPRHLADVGGPGSSGGEAFVSQIESHSSDIVGFGQNGVFVSVSNGDGTFADPLFVLNNFGTAQGWTSDNTYHRELADVNADGYADIVGFGQAGVFVARAIGDGTFEAPTFELANFAPGAGGWTSQDQFPRHLADVNNDGQADIVGFGQNSVFVSLAYGNGHFAEPVADVNSFGPSTGWTGNNAFPRELADVTGDGTPDIVGFGSTNVYVAPSHAYIQEAAPPPPPPPGDLFAVG